jgi:8-oxo-dGTP diphosphatase
MNRIYPKVPVCAVGAIIFKQDSVLLVKRGRAPACGKWSIPGGAVHLGETLGYAVTREVREETCLEIRPIQLAKVIDRIFKDADGNVQYHFVIVDFLCEVLSGEPKPCSDAADIGYFAVTNLDVLNMTEGTAAVIRDVYQNQLP